MKSNSKLNLKLAKVRVLTPVDSSKLNDVAGGWRWVCTFSTSENQDHL